MKVVIEGLNLRRDQIIRLNDAGCSVYVHRKKKLAPTDRITDKLACDVKLPEYAKIKESDGRGEAIIRKVYKGSTPREYYFGRKMVWTPMKGDKYGNLIGLTLHVN